MGGIFWLCVYFFVCYGINGFTGIVGGVIVLAIILFLLAASNPDGYHP